MNKKRISEVWAQIVSAYDATAEYSKFGRTGNPNKTLDVLFEAGVTAEEARQVLAIQAMIRPHDLRLDDSRKWLSLSIEPVSDWYGEYGKRLNQIDAIHPAHMNGLAMALKKRMEEA